MNNDYLKIQLFNKDSIKRRDRTIKRLHANYASIIKPYITHSILDIGPGRGEMLEWLIMKLKCTKVSAIDINSDVVEYINKQYKDCATLVSDTSDYLVTQKRRFSVITLMHVLEHLERDEALQVLQAVRNALCEGGLLLVEVPNNANIFVGGAIQSSDFTHRVPYTSVSLKQVLLMAGFDVVEVGSVKIAGWSLPRMIQRCLITFGNALQRVIAKVYLPSETFLYDATIYALAHVND